MRDSMVFYRSFAEAIDVLDEQDQLMAYRALIKYALDGEEIIERGAAKAILNMAKPQIDANNRRYQNGTKGGRPAVKAEPDDNLEETKAKPKDNQSKTRVEPNDNVYVNDNVNDKRLKDSCTEPKKFAPSSLPAVSFILNDGSMFDITENDVVEYQQLYPGIDVMQCLRNIKGWCRDNPKNRKTRNGARRFVNAWLAREQNRAPQKREKQVGYGNRFNNFQQRDNDYDALERQLLEAQARE